MPKLSEVLSKRPMLKTRRETQRENRGFAFWEPIRKTPESSEHDPEYETDTNGHTSVVSNPCTCCSCYFDVGPPGCNGTHCKSCGNC
jgi:hypothetical protein